MPMMNSSIHTYPFMLSVISCLSICKLVHFLCISVYMHVHVCVHAYVNDVKYCLWCAVFGSLTIFNVGIYGCGIKLNL